MTRVRSVRPARLAWPASLLIALVVASGCAGHPRVEDFDGLAPTDARFDPLNPDLFAHARPAGQESTITSWADGGTKFTVDNESWTLAGLNPGVCPEKGVNLMTAITTGQRVIVENDGGGRAWLWIVHDTETAQLVNALAARFGVGRAQDRPGRWMGTLRDESSALSSDQWRPATHACVTTPLP